MLIDETDEEIMDRIESAIFALADRMDTEEVLVIVKNVVHEAIANMEGDSEGSD